MNRAPRTLPSRYGFYTYPLYPADVRLPPPTPVTGLLAVLPGDFEAPWFIEHQIELETANKNLQNGVAAMNVSCQRTNESPDNKDTENHQLREQLNVLTQKLQMFTSRKAQDDRQIQQFRKFSTDQVAERNTLILKFDRVQEENHMLKSERELMTRKIKSLETMLRNGTEERRIERENFDSHQKESKLDLLAHKNHIEELTNEVNDLRDIVSIQKASSIAHKTENDELSMRIEKHMKIESNLKESLKTVLERTGKIRLELEQTREQQHNQDKEYREVLKQAQLDNDTLTKSNEKKDEEILRLKAEKLKGLWSTTPTKSVTIVRNCQKRHYEDDDDEWLPNSERKKRSVKEERFH